MELSLGYYIIIGIIILIGVIGMVGNIQLAACYRNWLRILREYEVNPNVGEQVLSSYRNNNDMSQHVRQHPVQHMVAEYMQHRSTGIEFVNTQAIIESNVYNQQISLLGLFRLPVNVAERLLKQLPSWCVILGLLGTFTGLTLALFDMQGTLLQLSSSSGAEVMTVSTMVAAISAPFKGMSFAFVTSIFGIGMSFCLHVLQSGLTGKIGLGPNFTQYKHIFMTRSESFLDHHIQAIVQKEKPKDSMEKLLDRLVIKVKESFDESVKAFGGEIVSMVDHLKQNMMGLEAILEQSATFTAQFQQGTAQLLEFGQALESYVLAIQQHEQKMAGKINDLAQTISALAQEFKQLSMKSDRSQQSLQKIVERSDQLIEQAVRKQEEIVHTFQKLSEDMQRQFHESLENEQRRFQQQQDDWSMRYQDKNDQFSRAAESFSQAVQHLERQWEDGLERFKRDITNQWGQVMDKYFGRHQAHNQQERDMKEMARELSMIQHVLERELQSQLRTSQETQQILLNMYEWGRRYAQEGNTRHPIVREGGY